MTFLESLRWQGSSYDSLASQCKVIETPLFVDLCWGEGLDVATILNDPGIEILKGSRQLFLMRIADEIRYYAGPSNSYDNEGEWERGVFPSNTEALAFGHAYLINGCPLSAIKTERIPKE